MEPSNQDQQPETIEQKEPYHDEGEYLPHLDKVVAEKKAVPTTSYGGSGHRIRIGKLFDNHEDFMYKIITVAGWARSLRTGNKDFCFVELYDGSHMNRLQVVVFKDIAGFDELVKCNVGTSFQFKGTLIKSPAKGQLFEL